MPDETPWFAKIKKMVQRLKRDIVALWYAARDSRVSWFAKIIAGGTAAYALSPIDAIPDFIPILGYLDDMLIVPAGIWLAIRLTPPVVMKDARAQAEATANAPISSGAAIAIVLLWVAAAALVANFVANAVEL